jgi:hypothetical protein
MYGMKKKKKVVKPKMKKKVMKKSQKIYQQIKNCMLE